MSKVKLKSGSETAKVKLKSGSETVRRTPMEAKVFFKTSPERKKLCESYCSHTEAGFSDDSFPDCSIGFFKELVTRYPNDFPAEKIEAAQRKRLKFWEEKGIEGKINASVWIFNMKNRFGWRDRHEEPVKEEELKNVEVTIVKN